MGGPQQSIQPLMKRALDEVFGGENPLQLDFIGLLHQRLLDSGCSPAIAELLIDYLPSACGRAFARELEMVCVDTYQRRQEDGSWDRSNGSPMIPFGWRSRHSSSDCERSRTNRESNSRNSRNAAPS